MIVPYFLNSVSSVLSVVKFLPKIGEGIWVLDYIILHHYVTLLYHLSTFFPLLFD